MTPIQDMESFGYRQELDRSLTVFDLLIYGLITMVPLAPMQVFGIVFNASKGSVPLIYLVGLVAMFFTALSYMTMSRAFPVAGSVYTYAARSLGPAIGFLAGWAILLDYLLVPALTYIICAIAVGAALPWVPKQVWVVMLLTFATAVNYFGIQTTARMNVVMLCIQLLILAMFVVAGIVALSGHVAGAHLSLRPFYNPTQFSPGVIFGSLSLAVLSFLGFDSISTLSEEVKGGAAAVAHATILALCVSAVLFVGQTYLASLFVLGHTAFADGDPTNAAFYGIAGIIGGTWLVVLVTIPGILVSGVAGALTSQTGTARLLFSMARDGKLPRALAHVHAERKVPERAIFLVAAVTLALGLWLVNQLELLTAVVSFGALLSFALLHISVIVEFFWRRKSRNVFRHLVSPAIGFLIIAYVLWNTENLAKLVGLCWMAGGLIVVLAARLKLGAATRTVG